MGAQKQDNEVLDETEAEECRVDMYAVFGDLQ